MHILVIEDEIKSAEYIRKGLSSNGFTVDIAHDGEDGLFKSIHQHYDLIIVDVMMPKLDGFTLVSMLRKRNNLVKVIFLTARDAIEDKVRGLEAGADDYLVKPFSFSELLARVRSALRRHAPQQEQLLTIADLSIDLIKCKVTRNGKRIDLTPKEYALLVLMAQRHGQVLSRTIIAENVWDINFDSDTNVIDVAIKRLRQKVDNDFDLKLIHTKRGMGYLLDERQ